MAAVKIVVKNVYKAAQAHEFLVPRGASVRELKALVAREFPENPAPADQKLIFGGKICNDGDVLDDMLAQQGQGGDGDEDEDVVSVVFHLLVTSKAAAVADAPKANTSAASPAVATRTDEDAAVDSPRPSTATAAQTPPPFTTPNLFAPPPAPATSSAVPSALPAASQHELYRQMALMQQQAMILTQIQYLQQLQQHQENASAAPIAHGVAGHAFAAPLVPPFMPFGNYFGGHMAHFPPHFPFAGAAAGAHAPAAPAAAAPVAPRGPPPMVVVMLREVLPLFEIRLALKMAFMLFLIGQDTPTDRVLMLGLLSFISYLYVLTTLVFATPCWVSPNICILVVTGTSRASSRRFMKFISATATPKPRGTALATNKLQRKEPPRRKPEAREEWAVVYRWPRDCCASRRTAAWRRTLSTLSRGCCCRSCRPGTLSRSREARRPCRRQRTRCPRALRSRCKVFRRIHRSPCRRQRDWNQGARGEAACRLI